VPDASPIKLDTGDAIAVSNQPQTAARGGHNRQWDAPVQRNWVRCWQREQFRSGKPPSARL